VYSVHLTPEPQTLEAEAEALVFLGLLLPQVQAEALAVVRIFGLWPLLQLLLIQ
jgi:hypothetical protein